MAFKNEYLTQEDKAMLAEKKLSYPRGIYWRRHEKYFGEQTIRWTADRENDYYLFFFHEYREEPEIKGFVLIWKKFEQNYIIPFLVKQRFIDNEQNQSVIEWNLNKMIIPRFLEDCREEIIHVAKEAFIAYGISGKPERVYSSNVENGLVTFNF